MRNWFQSLLSNRNLHRYAKEFADLLARLSRDADDHALELQKVTEANDKAITWARSVAKEEAEAAWAETVQQALAAVVGAVQVRESSPPTSLKAPGFNP
jgi:hypothetical protein